MLYYNAMACLILDTSTDLCMIALVKKKQILAQEVFLHQNNLSKTLLPAIKKLLESQEMTPSQLESIAIGCGPGSYTGTRVGVAVAKSLAFALQICMKSFLSPLAFLPQKEGQFLFLMPTRNNLFFQIRGVIEENGIFTEKSGLIDQEQMLLEAQRIPLLICAKPQSLHPLTCLLPTVNLTLLATQLLRTEPSAIDQIHLQYVEKNSPFS